VSFSVTNFVGFSFCAYSPVLELRPTFGWELNEKSDPDTEASSANFFFLVYNLGFSFWLRTGADCATSFSDSGSCLPPLFFGLAIGSSSSESFSVSVSSFTGVAGLGLGDYFCFGLSDRRDFFFLILSLFSFLGSSRGLLSLR
jgi:hypothetical protein